MPFRKTPSGRYKSPSGRTFTKKQVAAYYATDGFTKKVKPVGKKGTAKKRRKPKGRTTKRRYT